MSKLSIIMSSRKYVQSILFNVARSTKQPMTEKRVNKTYLLEVNKQRDIVNQLNQKNQRDQNLQILEELLQARQKYLNLINIFVHDGYLRQKIQFSAERRDLLVAIAQNVNQASQLADNPVPYFEKMLEIYYEAEGRLGNQYIDALCQLCQLKRKYHELEELYEELKEKIRNPTLKKVAIHLYLQKQSDDLYEDIQEMRDIEVDKELMEQYQFCVIIQGLQEKYYHSVMKHFEECQKMKMSDSKIQDLRSRFQSVKDKQAKEMLMQL